MKTRNADELMAKIRKGATAGFNVKDWQCALEALGWTVDEPTRGVYAITAPDGESFRLEKQPGYRVIVFYDFLKWAKVQGLMEAVEAKLGPAPVRAPRRDMMNTGTCACCFGNFKLWRPQTLKTMVLHGYVRPGHGYIIGNCPGVRFQPYELSCEGTVYMLGLVENAIDNKKAVLEMLATTTELWVRRWDAAAGNSKSVIMRAIEEPKWSFEAERRNQIAACEYEIEVMERDRATLDAKVKGWVLRPLPGAVPS